MACPSEYVGPPRLIDFSCRILEPDSGSAAACHLTLKLEDKKTSPDSDSGEIKTSRIDLEMQPSTLATLVDGLGRIRDQLTLVAKKK